MFAGSRFNKISPRGALRGFRRADRMKNLIASDHPIFAAFARDVGDFRGE
jgi:hypothetical protein